MYLHTPVITGGFITLAFDVGGCPLCNKPMIEVPEASLKRCESIVGSGVFNNSGGNTIAAQCERAGVVIESTSTDSKGRRICNTCAKAGRSTFFCVACNQERPTSEIETSFGDPPDRLCEKCYETLPAKEWDAIVDELSKSHRYDYM